MGRGWCGKRLTRICGFLVQIFVKVVCENYLEIDLLGNFDETDLEYLL